MFRSLATLMVAGCAPPLIVTLSLVGMLAAGAAAAGWPAFGGLLPSPGGMVLQVGQTVLAGSASFPIWAAPCGPEPGALAMDPSSCTGHPSPYPFAYQGFETGQCTWYVATRRLITWRTPQGSLGGNAGQWLELAAQAGYAVGPAPEVGAIAVYTDSGPGHVAFVVGVAADGDYTVAESNWALSGPISPYVDLRGVGAGSTGSSREVLAGFIYAPAGSPATG